MELSKVDINDPYSKVDKTERVMVASILYEDMAVENHLYAGSHPLTCRSTYEGLNPTINNLYEESHTLPGKTEELTPVAAAPVYATVNKRNKNDELPDSPKQYKYFETVTNSGDNISLTNNTNQPERMSKEITIQKISLILSVIAIVLFLALLIMVIITFLKVNSSDQIQMQNLTNESQEDGNRSSDLLQRIESLANLIQQQNDKYNNVQQQLSSLHNFPSSCADVLRAFPNSPSGYYTIRSNQSSVLFSVYCDMTRMCGGVRGGWMRIGQLDTLNCPQGLMNMTYNGIHTCILDNVEAGCTSLAYSSFGIPYSRVCGRVRAYDFGTLDGFHGTGFTNVTANYLDGVSLFYQNTHIWSFVGGHTDNSNSCNNRPDFVGTDYTYDGPGCNERQFCGNVLWDENSCGQYTPWIYRQLAGYTNANVVANVCRDSGRHNEDIAVSSIELYVY